VGLPSIDCKSFPIFDPQNSNGTAQMQSREVKSGSLPRGLADLVGLAWVLCLGKPRPPAESKNAAKASQKRLPLRTKSFGIIPDALLSGIKRVVSNRMMS
jgi:hypothetical protein